MCTLISIVVHCQLHLSMTYIGYTHDLLLQFTVAQHCAQNTMCYDFEADGMGTDLTGTVLPDCLLDSRSASTTARSLAPS